ncbi:MAG: hypothetical protein H6Q59_3349, partial [Firmicutes bacterium]|nr:hypothetical protein [Bacillota bacterium]
CAAKSFISIAPLYRGLFFGITEDMVQIVSYKGIEQADMI